MISHLWKLFHLPMLVARLTEIGMKNSKWEGNRVATLASIPKTFSKNSFGKTFKCAVYALMIVESCANGPRLLRQILSCSHGTTRHRGGYRFVLEPGIEYMLCVTSFRSSQHHPYFSLPTHSTFVRSSGSPCHLRLAMLSSSRCISSVDGSI